MKRLIILILPLIITSCTTRYFVVRHAEKENNANDPALSEAGLKRAEALKSLLLQENIDSIFVSDKKRTQQTAEPLASLLVKKPYVYSATPPGNQDLIRILKSIRGNKTVLVVGHSNTIPIVIDGLMNAPQHIDIADNDYDNLYLVKVKRFLLVKRNLTTKIYGEPTP